MKQRKDLINLIADYTDENSIIDRFIDYLDGDEQNLDQIKDRIILGIEEDEMIYYDDCFHFLEDHRITDFEEAIDEGYKEITLIANYYYQEWQLEKLDQEINTLEQNNQFMSELKELNNINENDSEQENIDKEKEKTM